MSFVEKILIVIIPPFDRPLILRSIPATILVEVDKIFQADILEDLGRGMRINQDIRDIILPVNLQELWVLGQRQDSP
jgi:hypothetical protein